jgi:hypothetical protein
MTEQMLHWPERVRALPMTLDRFRAAAVFFDVKFPPFLAGNLDAQKWISWGSLSAVASIPEVFEREAHVLGFATKWRSSPERDAMYNDTFLATLKELRNYETHLTYLTKRRTSEIPRDQIASPVDYRSFFFGPISFSQLSELRNIRAGRSPVDQVAVEEFNQLAETHTVKAIIDLGLDRLSEIIATFIISIGYTSTFTTGD